MRDRLSVEPAHILPEYTKSKLLADTPEQQFSNAFAAGDFNEDGRLDFALQIVGPSENHYPFKARIYLQDSAGAFEQKSEYILPNVDVGWEFVPVDLNEDGHLDIVADDSGNDMIVLLGKGNGTFQEPRFLGLAAAGFFAIADFNEDKHPDIAAGNLDGTVGVFLGAGNATFAPKATLDARVKPSHPRRGTVFAGDVNRDGKLDIVVCSLITVVPDTGSLDVFLGNGDGTFRDAIRTPRVAGRMGALADLNGDGGLDYAGDQFSPNQLEIWLGQIDGHFIKQKTYSTTGITVPVGLTVGDVNHDGIPDVLVAGEGDAGGAPLNIFLGKGDGTLQPARSFTQVDHLQPINTAPILVDFNHDGWLDMVGMAVVNSPPFPEFLTVALSHGINPDPELGILINAEVSVSEYGAHGQAHTLEATTDLIHWSPVATNGAWLPLRVIDTQRGNAHRFFRTQRPQ